jgi:hypothetical protein
MSSMNMSVTFPARLSSYYHVPSISPRDVFTTRVREDKEAVDRNRRLARLRKQLSDGSPEDWVTRRLVDVAHLPYMDAAVSAVNDETVFVRMSFSGGIGADVQFHPSGDAFVAIYRDDKSVFAGSGTVSAVVSDVRGFLQQP